MKKRILLVLLSLQTTPSRVWWSHLFSGEVTMGVCARLDVYIVTTNSTRPTDRPTDQPVVSPYGITIPAASRRIYAETSSPQVPAQRPFTVYCILPRVLRATRFTPWPSRRLLSARRLRWWRRKRRRHWLSWRRRVCCAPGGGRLSPVSSLVSRCSVTGESERKSKRTRYKRWEKGKNVGG